MTPYREYNKEGGKLYWLIKTMADFDSNTSTSCEAFGFVSQKVMRVLCCSASGKSRHMVTKSFLSARWSTPSACLQHETNLP